MKRILSSLALFAALLLPLPAAAQGGRAAVHPDLEPLLTGAKADRIPARLRGPLGNFQGRKLLAGHEALSLEIRTTATREQLEGAGIHVRTLGDGIATVTVLPSSLPALVSRPDVSAVTIPRLTHPVLSKSVPDTGITRLRTQSGGTFTGTTGAGALVGVIDSGLDVHHPNFKDALGHTRIRYLWDQTHNPGGAGVIPAGFAYGTEWTAADIDGGLCTEQDDAAAEGHGTHVTGTAAGNGAAPDENGVAYSHVGVAPEAGIVFVKTTFMTDDIIDALDYIFARADALGLPCVVNLSLGTNLGSHDGTDPMEQEIDSLVTAKAGRAVVVAAGNARQDAAHAQVTATAGTTVAGPIVLVPSYTANGGTGNDTVWVTGYYASTDTLTVQLISPNGEAYLRALTTTGCLPEINGFDGTVLLCNTKLSSIGEGTTAREIFIRISDGVANKPPKAGGWKINLTGNTVTSGTVDFWVASNLGPDPNKVATFSTLSTYLGTLGIPATSKQAIAVGAYVTRQCWKDHNGVQEQYASTYVNGDIAPFSSAGPTRDLRWKPEIAAPGMGIIAPLAAEVKAALLASTEAPFVVNDSYLLLQGTSMAAPHVTGAVALLFQQSPGLTASAVTTTLQSHARTDLLTAKYVGIFGINVSFGAGKLDLGSWAYTDPDETNDTASQATPILSGQILKGYIDRADDVDYYNLSALVAGDTVSISLTGLPHDYSLSLQAQGIAFSVCQDGGMYTKTSSNNPGTASEFINYTAATGIGPVLQGAPSFIRVASPAGAFDEVNGYLIQAILTRPETAGTHNSTATAQKLPEFQQMKVAGGISAAGENDYYTLSLWSGPLTVTASGRTIKLLDSNGNQLASAVGTLNTSTSGGFFSTAKYYIVISGGSLSAYTMTVTLP